MALYDYEQSLRPTQGPSTILRPGAAPAAPVDPNAPRPVTALEGFRNAVLGGRSAATPSGSTSLRAIYDQPGSSAAPDFSGAMGGNDASAILAQPTAAPPSSLQPQAMFATRPMDAPASQPGNPTAQVRAVDNGVNNAAAIANPASVQPQSYAPSGSVTALPGGTDTLGQLQRDIAHAQDMQKLRNPNDPTPGMAVINGNFADRNAAFNDAANLRNAAAQQSWSPRGGYKGNEAAVAAAAMPIQNRQRLSELSLTNEGRMAESRLRDATDRRGQDLAAQTASLRDATDRRGQDVTARGQDMTAKTAAASARLEQMNKDRSFQLDAAKYGQDVAKTNFDQRQKAQESVTSQITAMLPPGADGKPDTANAARYTAGLNTLVSDRMNALQAQLAKTPGRKDVADELEALQSKGLAAMDQTAIRKYIVGQQTADVAAQTGTGRFTPWGTNAANSTAPITSLREDKGFFGSDYISDRGDVIPGRYLRQDGKLNQDLRNLIRQ